MGAAMYNQTGETPTSQISANRQKVDEFLEKHGLSFYGQEVINELLETYTAEMAQGLAGSSSLEMIPSYISADIEFVRDRAALVLDAGGTNLRCALVTLSHSPLLEHFSQREMPGRSTVLSAQQFLFEIAEFMAPAIDAHYQRYSAAPACLGFCFSYPSRIFMRNETELDGVLLQWSKEIQVPELVGREIGVLLLEALKGRFGPKAPRRISLLNDTVATLLAGKAVNQNYDDFIGYILGTGINSCYAEDSAQILGLDARYREQRMIVNLESGNYCRFPQSEIDCEYDRLTQTPGSYLQEKACSGRYWGGLLCVALRTAAREGLLPEEFATLPLQESVAMNALLQYPDAQEGPAAAFLAWLDEQCCPAMVRERCYVIAEALLERSALFTAVNMAACILRTNRGHSPLYPICLTVDGSAFYAFCDFPLRVRFWLDSILKKGRGVGRFYRIKYVENAPLLGAAILALSTEAQS